MASAMDVDNDKPRQKLLNHTYDYDLIVIGGGSGGISCAKEASECGAKVALFDFVTPTNHGTKWGLGGTCVNVGCIPKKMMHYSSSLGDQIFDANALGWDVPPNSHKMKFSWDKMINTVNLYIKSLNFGYKKQLIQYEIEYIRAYAKFVDDHTVEYQKRKKPITQVSAKYIVLAMGGRPKIPNSVIGKELAITSDDIFWLKKAPGKTLCVGASYISLETAGFLHGMGYDVTVAVRSILLRGFDRDCADHIGKYMKEIGVKFKEKYTPIQLEKTNDDRIKVTFKSNAPPQATTHSVDDDKDKDDNDQNMNTNDDDDDDDIYGSAGADDNDNDNKVDDNKDDDDVYDTVLFATGRAPETLRLNLSVTGVLLDQDTGKIRCSKEQTNISHIYAVGDIVYGAPELTPVAIQAGKLLALRLFKNANNWMDYAFVPTTIFTPIEYSCCGYSEEEAGDVYGEDNIEIYHMKNNPLETYGVQRVNKNNIIMSNTLYFKLICNKLQNNRVVGFHYIGPNAGEVMQGFALALKVGCSKSDLDNLVGIHPTCAEWFTVLKVTKSSGVDATATAC